MVSPWIRTLRTRIGGTTPTDLRGGKYEEALVFCLRVARFAESLAGMDGQPWSPEDFRLELDVIDKRLAGAEKIIEEHSKQLRSPKRKGVVG